MNVFDEYVEYGIEYFDLIDRNDNRIAPVILIRWENNQMKEEKEG